MNRVVNIGTRGRRWRFAGGLAGGLVGVSLVAFLVTTGAPRVWRLAALLPFFGAAYGVLQAREKT